MTFLSKKYKTLFLWGILSLPLAVSAQEGGAPGQEQDNSMHDLVQYLKNLGSYLGFDLTKDPNAQGADPKMQELLNASGTQLMQAYVFNTFLGAISLNQPTLLVPKGLTIAASLNAWANYTFRNPSYENDQQKQGKITVNALLDQQTYQPDPVSQAVFNILTTPSSTYCLDERTNTRLAQGDCPPLFQAKVTENTIGAIPEQYFNAQYNQKILAQLNSDSLVGPLLYSFDELPNENPNQSPNMEKQAGLTAMNQAQQAANFIRYATTSVLPLPLAERASYEKLYIQAANFSKQVSEQDQLQAKNTLANYLTSVRIYASQASVGISNLYTMLARRMPQNQSNDKANPSPTSTALSEFTMASWRLYNPTDGNQNKQWLDQINKASTATVQKEMVVLLAEINYQLYLSRQQQERLLLTNSILLLQNLQQNNPTQQNATFMMQQAKSGGNAPPEPPPH